MENIFLYFMLPLFIGVLLDRLLGDPCNLPHPIRWFGKIIELADCTCNKGQFKKTKGALVSIVLIVLAYSIPWGISKILAPYTIAFILFLSVCVFYNLAYQSLVTEVKKVNKTLEQGFILKARKQLSYIVGRDTAQLSEQQVRIASLETLSENMSDGIIAPLFFYALGGVPLMCAYKMINTLDSMIAYKNPTYKEFGYVAAKIDDIANFLPSRISAYLLFVVSGNPTILRYIRLYARKHDSPNSGYPEAALAGYLRCAFGGSAFYKGVKVHKPLIGSGLRTLSYTDALQSIRLVGRAYVAFLMLIGIASCFFMIK